MRSRGVKNIGTRGGHHTIGGIAAGGMVAAGGDLERGRDPIRAQPHDGLASAEKRERLPTIDTLLRITGALEADLAKLLGWAHRPPAQKPLHRSIIHIEC